MDNYFFIKSGYKIQKILVDEIIYVESMGDYIRFYLDDKKIVALLSLSKIIELLHSDKFILYFCPKIILINFNLLFVLGWCFKFGSIKVDLSKILLKCENALNPFSP